jgi:LPPG:FO 2-phospho-L-lactate transferase
MAAVRVTVIAGGIGGARFLRGLREVVGRDAITVIGNTGDDVTMFGLRICPDLDTVMYTLGGGISAERGWGREGESFVVKEELAAYAEEPMWFGLGDRDIATHLVRSRLLREGVPLSAVTARLCARWRPGVRLLPMTDEPVETHVRLVDGRDVHFQEWWVRLHAGEPAVEISLQGKESARPAPGVVESLRDADVVVLPPSNPVVSIGTVLSVPGIRPALVECGAPVVGVSPIIGGAPVRGMADACLAAIGVETSAEAVARHYGARAQGGIRDGWLVDEVDKAAADTLVEDGLPTRAVPLWMHDVEASARMAQAALDLAAAVRS